MIRHSTAVYPEYELYANDPSCGVVIGSYGMPGVVELNIAAVRHYCGNVPILIADDNTPDSQGRKRILQLAEKWDGVDVIINKENLGHAPGDVRAFRNGLLWAKRKYIKYICKLSQRFIFVKKRWLQNAVDEMMMYAAKVSTQPCYHLNMNFHMRTECVFLEVAPCVTTPKFMKFLEPANGKIMASAEDWMTAAIAEGKLVDTHADGRAGFHRCSLLPIDRFKKVPHIIWHNTDGVDVYNQGGKAYFELAEKLGVNLGPEFSAAGWHIIAAHRPEANYHML